MTIPSIARRPVIWLGVLMITVLVPAAGCGTGINLVGEDEEWQMGEELERDINRQVQLVNDQALQSYVQTMGRRIVAQTPMSNRSWRFHVIQDASVNAFNAPGGLIYIHTGLIATADNAAELAGVMAHEIAHGTARHGTQRLSQVYGLNVAAAILLGSDPGLVQQVAAQIVAGGSVAAFSRGMEREADQLGVRYMAAAGYNPDGMVSLLEKLIAERQRQPGAVEQFFSTHPLTEERIRDVRNHARSVNRSGLIMNDNQFNSISSRAAQYR